MIIIDDKLVSDEVVKEAFVCDLRACKGACCVEGDYGAPLEAEETGILAEIYPLVKDFLLPEGRAAIEAQGTHVPGEEAGDFATPLVAGGPCAYMTRDELGIARCGIEQAWRAGAVEFQKPVSCHLYPIRITKLPDYEALNYHRWEICSAACALGEKLKVPVYVFLKDPIVRRYGADFYEALDAAAKLVED
jgi:hypothetical protein